MSEGLGTWIALLRGINVAGKNKLPMRDLVAELESLGLEDVRTYIQSGNVVFRSSDPDAGELGLRIAAAIERGHGFRPRVLVCDARRLRRAMKDNPFPEAENDPKSLHVFFLESAPATPDIESISAAKSSSERFELVDDHFYLHAPDGIGRSKLAAGAERWLGAGSTARNWRTVRKLSEMTD